jgi:glycosyltransferase involved in cell wall biosynthesis
MKILQVCPIFPPRPKEFGSGVTQVVYNVSKELAKGGHKVEVYTSNALDVNTKIEDKSDLMLVDGIKVYHFPYVTHYYTFFLTPSMISAVRRNLKEFDIIHIHDLRAFQSIVVHYYARKYGVPYVLQAHGSLPRVGAWRKLKWIYDVLFGYKLLRDASRVIALSRVEAEQYKRMGVPEEKIAIIPNGIDLSEYANLPPKGCFKKKFGIKEEEKIVLYLGRIHKSKGLDLLAEAFSLVTKELENVKLVMIGPDGGYASAFSILISRLGIWEKVLLTGFVEKEDKLAVLVDSDVFVTPRFYGFPITFLEACVAELPIVTTKCGDELDLIHNGAGLVAKYSPQSFAEALIYLLTNVDIARRMGRDAKRLLLNEFTLQKVVNKLERVYETIVKSSV